MVRKFKEFPFKNFDKSCRIAKEIAIRTKGYGGSSFMALPESAMLYEIAKELGDRDSGLILEFGTLYGTSAVVIGTGLKDANIDHTLITVDTNWFPMRNTFGIARQTVFHLRLEHHIAQVTFDDMGFWRNFLADKSIQFVFLDTNHEYEYVTNQMEALFPKIIEGGWCLIHDYNELHFDEAVKAVNEFIDKKSPNSIEVFLCESTVAIIKKQL